MGEASRGFAPCADVSSHARTRADKERSRRLARLDRTLGMSWELSHRADPRGVAIADNHYSRQKPGSPQFMPPGGCCVLYARTRSGAALWGLSTPFAKYVKHAWAGAWMCSIFRNEGAGPASRLIREAVAANLAVLGDPPALGIVTFVHPRKVMATFCEGCDEPIYGQAFRQAGFREVGETKGGLIALQLVPADMPKPISPHGHQGQFYLARAA